MSTRYFIGERVKGVHIGTKFATKEGPAFGFTPLRENVIDSLVIQPGNLGYGLAMLEYWKSILNPETPIVDIYAHVTSWQIFMKNLELVGGMNLSDEFVGIMS